MQSMRKSIWHQEGKLRIGHSLVHMQTTDYLKDLRQNWKTIDVRLFLMTDVSELFNPFTKSMCTTRSTLPVERLWLPRNLALLLLSKTLHFMLDTDTALFTIMLWDFSDTSSRRTLTYAFPFVKVSDIFHLQHPHECQDSGVKVFGAFLIFFFHFSMRLGENETSVSDASKSFRGFWPPVSLNSDGNCQ